MTGPLVLDASAAAGWFLPDEATPESLKLLEWVAKGSSPLVEPPLFGYEILNMLRYAVARRRTTEPEAKMALHSIKDLPVEEVPLTPETRSLVLETADRHNLTAYDAAYFVLADLRGLPLVTADKDLLRLRSKFRWVKGISDFVGASPS